MHILPFIAHGPIAGEGAVHDWDIPIKSGPSMRKAAGTRADKTPAAKKTSRSSSTGSDGAAEQLPGRGAGQQQNGDGSENEGDCEGSSILTRGSKLKSRQALRDSNRAFKKNRCKGSSEQQEQRLQVAAEMKEQLERSNALQDEKLQISKAKELMNLYNRELEPEEFAKYRGEYMQLLRARAFVPAAAGTPAAVPPIAVVRAVALTVLPDEAYFQDAALAALSGRFSA